MSRTFSSLSIPNYRVYFVGGLVSNIGGWMSRTAQSWLVLVELTNNNATALGWLTAVMFLPTLLLTPIAGAAADRFPKRTIMLLDQVAMTLSATTLAILVITGNAKLWMVFALAAWDGVATAFDNPARQAFVSELVPGDGLSNAIGLNSTSFNAARLIGPGAAGLLIAFIGTGWVFLINAASFVVLILALLRLDLNAIQTTVSRGRNSILAGVRYVRRRPDLLLLFSIALMMGTFAFNYTITNALMATEVFGRGAGEYGALGSIMGIGSLTGALLAARRARPRIRHVVTYMGLFALSLLLSAQVGSYTMFSLLMVPMGLTSVSVMVAANSLVQMSVSAEVRGRVMALWGAVVMGLTPVVSPILGWIGDTVGARATVLFGAVGIGLTFIAVLVYLVRNQPVAIHLSNRRPWLQFDNNLTEDVPKVG